MPKQPKDCPCDSRARYAACCKPFHDRTRVPQTASELMRARFAAFATGHVQFLRDTLSPRHADAQRDEAELLRELRQTSTRHTFPRLKVLDARELSADRAQVLFHAEVYESGKDRSFVELSEFDRVDGQWRYRSGRLVNPRQVKGELATLNIPGFEQQFPATQPE